MLAFIVLTYLTASLNGEASAEDDRLYDVVIYGGSSAGIAAAIQVQRMGGSVVIVEPGNRIGGLTTGGLGQTDIGNKAAIGGIAREFYQRVRRYYDHPENWRWQSRQEYQDSGQTRTGANEETMWTFEPSAALAIMQEWVREDDIQLELDQRLDRTSTSAHDAERRATLQSSNHDAERRATLRTSGRVRGVTLDGKRIVAIRTESGRTFRGRVFIDATYEGDLLAGAGISYTVGREGNDVYDETLNGVQTRQAIYHQFVPGVDPYVVSGDASSGLLPGIDANGPGEEGHGDSRLQAFCYRMCLTDHPENRIPFIKPAEYDPLVYELLLRNFEAGERGMPWINSGMPNRKTDTNNRTAFSTDYIGYNYDYPDASYEERDAIRRSHLIYQQGLMWTLANHPRVPDHVRQEVARWGMCRDEFEQGAGWQQQLYVREARRMLGATVMTQHHCQGREVAQDAIGLAAYTMDSHNVQRYVAANGNVLNEGDVEVGGFSPYGIAYGALSPKSSECENLLVPVCLSASHIAFGSIRMEPVFMVLGQSAATAAMQAIETNVPVQEIDFGVLKERLIADGQILTWDGPVKKPTVSLDPQSLDGIVVDDEAATRTGFDAMSHSIGPFVAIGYRHDGNTDKGHQSIQFPIMIEEAGLYQVRISYTPNANRATNVPVTVHAGDKSHKVKVDQRAAIEQGAFATIGEYHFPVGRALVEFSNAETDGYVVVDAVQLLPLK
ncbi:MAG: FAD-dependent oxidoreductase [Pirellulaceae bacterium]|nr:FAD-dependent oxidoreductase [Pirellulaceae bacterium]